jgi:hypothetical protein
MNIYTGSHSGRDGWIGGVEKPGIAHLDREGNQQLQDPTSRPVSQYAINRLRYAQPWSTSYMAITVTFSSTLEAR